MASIAYYNATRLRLDTSDLYAAQTPQHVQLFDPLAANAPAKNLTEGTWVLATFNADTGRWEIVRDPYLPVPIVRFRLTATLTLGGVATAVRRNWDPTAAGGAGAYASGDSITVVDYFGSIGNRGEWQAPSGYEGFAVKLADNAQYQVLYMEHQALFAEVTLTSDIDLQQANANFTSYWAGRNTSAAVNVYDSQNLYPNLKSGDKVKVVWDSFRQEYVIFDAKQTAPGTIFYARTYSSHTLAPSSKSTAHYVECQAVNDLAGDGFDSGSAHFIVFLPSPSSATDPNVDASTIIGYTVDSAGVKVCVTDYLDDARGMLKIWGGSAASVPHGWALCDGTSYGSVTTPNLEGMFVLAALPGDGSNFDGQGNTRDVGASGGTPQHSHKPHAPAATSSVSLDVEVNMTGAPFVSGTTGPAIVAATTTVTWSLYAQGVTDPTGLFVSGGATGVTFSGTTDSATTGISVIDPATGTVDHAPHYHIVDGNTIEPQIKGGSDIKATFLSGCADSSTLTTGMVVDCSAASVTYAHEVDDPGHEHTFTVDADINFETAIIPNPHVHSLTQVPVFGSITAYTTTAPHTHDFAGFVEGLTFSPCTVTPNPHFHNTPWLAHDFANHIPPYYALCYIMRVD